MCLEVVLRSKLTAVYSSRNAYKIVYQSDFVYLCIDAEGRVVGDYRF